MASTETIYQIAESERKVFVPLSANAAKKKEMVKNYYVESGLARTIDGKLMTRLNRKKPIEYGDSLNWCSAFANWVAMKAGVDQSNSIAARSWRQIGEGVKMKDSKRGDVVVFWRKDSSHPDWDKDQNKRKGWKGHVGFFVELVGKDKVKVLGGNQSNTIKESTYDIDGSSRGVIGVRRLAPAGLRNTAVKETPRTVFYVAPDPPKDKPFHFDHINTLAVKPKYRLSLRLGNVDALFPEGLDKTKDIDFKKLDGTTTKVKIRPGLKGRLQVAGLFPRPLAHAESDECLYVVWKYIKEQLVESLELAYEDKTSTKPTARDPEQRALDLFRPGGIIDPYLIAGGRIPAPGKTAKARLPGGYYYFGKWNGRSSDPGDGYYFGDDRFAVEATHFRDNPALGKIPLVAQIEKRVGKDEWKPAERVSVYFQLVTPDPQAEANLRKTSSALAAPATGDKGPYAYVKKRNPDYQNADAEDPQAGNTHFDFGGKRAMEMDGTRHVVSGKKQIQVTGDGGWVKTSTASFDWDNIFSVEDVKGFNVKHDDRDLPHKPYPTAKAPEKDENNPGHHANAVTALTNEDGEAGAIFMPSTIGGDTYKLRVYIGPPSFESTGIESDAIVVDTGTLERWRTIRLSRHFKHTTPAKLPTKIQDEFDDYNKGFLKALKGNKKTPLYASQGKVDTADLKGQIRNEYAKSFCEFIVEPLANSVQDLYKTPGIKQAYERAIAYTKRKAAAAGIVLNIDKLMFYCEDSPFTVNLSTPRAYNKAETDVNKQLWTDHVGDLDGWRWKYKSSSTGKKVVTYGLHDDDEKDATKLVNTYFLPRFLKEIDDNRGYLPGVTVIQGPLGDTYTGFLALNDEFTTSGVGLGPACYLWYGDAYRTMKPARNFPYNVSANGLHEIGHCLYLVHQNDEANYASDLTLYNRKKYPKKTFSGGSGMGNDPDNAPLHDPNDRCVMSYMDCEGEYCGQCVCAFRGKLTRSGTFRNA